VAGSGAVFPQGQVAPVRPQKRIITKTRLVAICSDLENQLFQAVQSKDRAGLDSILAEDFQLWTPNPPGRPGTAREAYWQRLVTPAGGNQARVVTLLTILIIFDFGICSAYA